MFRNNSWLYSAEDFVTENVDTYLKELESDSIYIFREIVAQFERPVLLFSGGKDSITLVHLAKKDFYPGKIPFPLLHIDTGHNFPETIAFRDALNAELGTTLIIGSVEESIKNGRVQEELGFYASRNKLQTTTLLDVLEKNQFDCAIGGARRDEEKARAKERIFSHRNEFGEWNPKNQRPELWNLLNGHKQPGEHFRAFPISNWTEEDVWNYIKAENINLPGLYFSHERKVFERDGQLLADAGLIQMKDNEQSKIMTVRFRTIGDITCTGAMISSATTVDEVILEIAGSLTSERGTRSDDKRTETAMEDRKKSGYF